MLGGRRGLAVSSLQYDCTGDLGYLFSVWLVWLPLERQAARVEEESVGAADSHSRIADSHSQFVYDR